MRHYAISVAVVLGAAAPAASQDLTVTAFGGIWEESLRKCTIEPFQAATGKQVAVQLGGSAQWLNQISATPSNPPIDVLLISSDAAFDAVERGLVEHLTTEQVPALDQILPRFRELTGDNGAVHNYGTMGVLYNKDVIDEPPASWNELIDGTIEGRWTLAIPGVNNGISAMLTTVWYWSTQLGGDIDNVDPAFEKLAEMRDSGNLVVWNSSSDVIPMMGSGEADIAVYWDGRAWAFIRDGNDEFDFYGPEPGMVPALTWVQKVKNGRELGYEFIDFMLQEEQQSCFAANILYGVGNENATVPGDLQAYMPDHEGLVFPPFEDAAANLASWVERWNREVD
ncbi:extracellular solute-binding protein [Aureimonas mangrovi]|uniref:extracellular solute-binding protein n=1 Tax=Aureimonas mangrovi TaxID=2758041 RepID=UPI00163DB5AC|nr:extracellular solute-binding protein [Aureimonas mangrovi]